MKIHFLHFTYGACFFRQAFQRQPLRGLSSAEKFSAVLVGAKKRAHHTQTLSLWSRQFECPSSSTDFGTIIGIRWTLGVLSGSTPGLLRVRRFHSETGSELSHRVARQRHWTANWRELDESLILNRQTWQEALVKCRWSHESLWWTESLWPFPSISHLLISNQLSQMETFYHQWSSFEVDDSQVNSVQLN